MKLVPHTARLIPLALAGAAAFGCTQVQRTDAEAPARREPAAVLPAAPRHVIAAAEQAFIELNLVPASAEATARGGCALARTGEGDTVTVTATTAGPATSLVRVHVPTRDADDTTGLHLIESIAAHLSVGASASAR